MIYLVHSVLLKFHLRPQLKVIHNLLTLAELLPIDYEKMVVWHDLKKCILVKQEVWPEYLS